MEQHKQIFQELKFVQMEPEEDEASDHQQPKRIKPTNPSLPQELIMDVLVRLPVKYLLQFKCVSKDWLSLISSPQFIKTHLSFSAKDSTRHRLMLILETYRPLEHNVKHCSVSSLFNESVTEAFDLDHPMKNLDKVAYIVGSVNGLICLYVGLSRLVLWNPSTRKFEQLPDFMTTQTDRYLPMHCFGYDEIHDDYKVVGIYSKISSYSVDARIYSLKSKSCRRLYDFQGRVLDPHVAKLVNGKLHLLTTMVDSCGPWCIVSIDLVDEKCRQLELPCYEDEKYNLTIGVLGSDISVLCNYMRGYDITRVDVWVMKEYGVKESWTKLYSIKYPFEHVIYGPTPHLVMSNKGEILLVIGSTLVIYNPEDDSLRYLEVTNFDGRLEAELYIESLVCPILLNEPTAQQ